MIRDGTQERQIDPPDERTYTERELREMEGEARRGFRAMDEHACAWLEHELADTPKDIADLVRNACCIPNRAMLGYAAEVADFARRIRDRYAEECLLDYAGSFAGEER